MANPLFKQINGGQSPQSGNMLQQFKRFMKEMKGRNPDQMLSELVKSGRVNQQQLDAAQQQARQMPGIFDQLKGMF